jgi:ferrous iron transport protein A
MVGTSTVFSFRNVKKGMRARVVSIESTSPEARRLQEMGLTVGTEFDVVKVAPFGDPVEITLRGYRLCLRKHETAHINIELVQ